jgi:indolepyruvate ferredoxin oxidoreductase
MNRKIRLKGRTAEITFRALRAARGLRGTPLDVFGYAKVRRVERELVAEYQGLVRATLEHLDAGNAEQVVELAVLPDLVRGYEDIKLAAVERFRDRAGALLAVITGTG